MKSIFVSLFVFFSIIASAQVRLNEIQSSNSSTIADEMGDYDDWIEIYNSSDSEIDIGGLVLKDKVDVWQIPIGNENTVLAPKSYFLLWADDEEHQGLFHTNFKLSASNGEFLGLYLSDSITVIDSLTLPPMSSDQSYSFCDNLIWDFGFTATPLSENDCYDAISDQIKQNIIIYPNFTNGIVYIKSPEFLNEHIQILVFSSSGHMVINQMIKSSRTTLDLNTFSDGIYIITINDGMFSTKEKIILIK